MQQTSVCLKTQKGLTLHADGLTVVMSCYCQCCIFKGKITDLGREISQDSSQASLDVTCTKQSLQHICDFFCKQLDVITCQGLTKLQSVVLKEKLKFSYYNPCPQHAHLTS